MVRLKNVTWHIRLLEKPGDGLQKLDFIFQIFKKNFNFQFLNF